MAKIMNDYDLKIISRYLPSIMCLHQTLDIISEVFPKTVFRSIYNFKIDNSKRMLCATIQRKRPMKIIEKFDKINEILSEFDNLQPDLQISSLCSTLERLGSL